MKILVTGYHNPNYETITEYIEQAIEAEGHTCLVFDDRQYMWPGRIRQLVATLERAEVRRMNQQLLALAEKERPDVCLVTGGHRVLPETVMAMKVMDIQTVLWTVDAPTHFQPILDAAPCYHYIFCGGSEAIELFEAQGICHARWLPFACRMPSKHITWGITDTSDMDVVFIGSHYPNREVILEGLAGYQLGIWGPGWKERVTSGVLRSCVRGQGLRPGEWQRVYRSAKIILAIHYQDGRVPCYQASPKIYEALSCGGFVLSDAQRDVLRLFKDGKHLAVFQSPKDLRAKVDAYLRQDVLRRKIADQGCTEVGEHHTYAHRVQKILTTVKAYAPA